MVARRSTTVSERYENLRKLSRRCTIDPGKRSHYASRCLDLSCWLGLAGAQVTIRVKPYQALRRDLIFCAEKHGNIHVQWTIGLCTGQKLVYCSQCRLNGICRRPRALEQIKTYFSCLEVHIGVTDWCFEGHNGRCKWIIRRYIYSDAPKSTYNAGKVSNPYLVNTAKRAIAGCQTDLRMQYL